MARGGAVVNRVLDRLWIGSLRDLGPEVPLRALGFVAVVDLRDDFRGAMEITGVAVHNLTNRDGDPWTAAEVEGALAFVHDHVQRGKVLVACAAGMSRSASVAIGYLVRCGWDAASAYARVREARGKVAPVGKMLESVFPVSIVHGCADGYHRRGCGHTLGPDQPKLPSREELTHYLTVIETTSTCDHIADKVTWNTRYAPGEKVDVVCKRVEIAPGVTQRNSGCRHTVSLTELRRWQSTGSRVDKPTTPAATDLPVAPPVGRVPQDAERPQCVPEELISKPRGA